MAGNYLPRLQDKLGGQLDKIADKIIALIDRLPYTLIETVGYWVSIRVAGTETEHKLTTLAHSILSNIKERHDQKQGR